MTPLWDSELGERMETLDVETDILVVGGGLGGVAAALRACRSGYTVCLTDENTWIGGQCTSQAVSAPDEHEYIETFGGTASYYEFRDGIRAHYENRYDLSETAAAAPFLNPGDGWVSRLCFEPDVGVAVILGLLLPEVESGRLQIHYGARALAADCRDGHIHSVTLTQLGRLRQLNCRAAYVLDATELGDLLPLAGLPYVTGAESRDQTGEPDARADGPAPELVQTFTFPFVVDYRPGEDHTIARPPDYERNRDEQPYTLTLRYGERDLTYKVFEGVADLPGAFWTYRRILAADQFGDGQVKGDLAMINWAGNDFKGGSIIDAEVADRAAILQRARELSLGFLHWLQTEVPRDDGDGLGYPGLRLRPDVVGTADGLSQYPYVRESRRVIAHRTVHQQDVMARFQPGARAALFDDSVGLGWYPIDIHGVPGDVAATGPTRPFQIPLGALVPRDVGNLLPACKNLGVTHITNGCYRLHPVEWNIGESAAALAVFCLARGSTPAAVLESADLRHRYQRELAHAGVPLHWFVDVPLGDPAFGAVQMLAARGWWCGADDHLRYEPEAEAGEAMHRQVLERSGLSADQVGASSARRRDLALAVDAARP